MRAARAAPSPAILAASHGPPHPHPKPLSCTAGACGALPERGCKGVGRQAAARVGGAGLGRFGGRRARSARFVN
ncbi:MAG: hypothetical protein E6H79_09590 [Betaproteobacteria bacterium]|nr:MAG: hypothetical protein E6H79_09590 [Betaproteobacteria bacterium]